MNQRVVFLSILAILSGLGVGLYFALSSIGSSNNDSTFKYQVRFIARSELKSNETYTGELIMYSQDSMDVYFSMQDDFQIWMTREHPQGLYMSKNSSGCLSSGGNVVGMASNIINKLYNIDESQVKTNIGTQRFSNLISKYTDNLTYKFTSLDADYYIFVFGSGNKLLTVLGKEFTATITFFTNSPIGLTVNIPENLKKDCKNTFNLTNFNQNFQESLSSKHYITTCFWNCERTYTRKFRLNPSLQQSSYRDKCIFLHGLTGTNGVDDNYWGGSDGPLFSALRSNCREIVTPYFSFPNYPNTANTPATDPVVQNAYYEVANSAGSNGVVFCHSMCNVILARACIDQNKCAKFYSINAPIYGSTSSDRMYYYCPTSSGGLSTSSSLIDSVVGAVADTIGKCTSNVYTLQTCGSSYNPLSSICSISNITKVLPYIQGTHCGQSAWGLNTMFSVPSDAIGKTFTATNSYNPSFVYNTNINDGVVPLTSCSPFFKGYPPSTSYVDRYYLSSTSHIDGTGKNGDGWYGSDRKPVSWILEMVKKGMY